MKIHHITIIGAGTMGQQIALQIARHNLRATLFDINPDALSRAQETHHRIISDWIANGIESTEAHRRIPNSITYETNLPAALQNADLAIEAVPENLPLKRQVFAQIDSLLDPNAIIASNSSSIRISLIETATNNPARLANLHFYLPVWDSPMAEIAGGPRTKPAVLKALSDFTRQIGLLPLRLHKESAGFILNRVWRAIKKEAMKVADCGIASPQDIDRAWMLKFGRDKPPPFAQMDRIGLDVIRDIELHYAAESGDPDDLPRPILTEKIARGELGIKTGRGFYDYPNPAYAADDFLDPTSN